MAEYIERESLLAKYDEVHIGEPGGARKLIEEAPSVDVIAQWISVKDKLPNHEQRCLIFTDIYFTPDHIDDCNYYGGIEISRYYEDLGFGSENGFFAKYWMPLPEAPKEKGGE